MELMLVSRWYQPLSPPKWTNIVCVGIIATTLGHDTFKLYMLGPTMTNAPLLGK